MKGLLFGVLGLAAGLVVGMVVKGSGSTTGVETHWRVVREHLRLIKNPKNYKVDESLGLASVEIKTDPIPSLYALASAGEIEHRDIVLPNVPANRESTGFWMKFCEEREGIIYATGNASFGDLMIEGVRPVHLNIWFDESAEADVAELIDLLQKTGKDE